MQEDTTHVRAEEEGIFPTFFMAGFEASTFIWKDGHRKDYIAITGHDAHLEKDYRQLMRVVSSMMV